MQNFQTSHVARAMTTRPPTTPPAMAPAVDELRPEGGDDAEGSCPTVLVLTQEVEGQEVHDAVERRHFSSEAQTGQDGLTLSH